MARCELDHDRLGGVGGSYEEELIAGDMDIDLTDEVRHVDASFDGTSRSSAMPTRFAVRTGLRLGWLPRRRR